VKNGNEIAYRNCRFLSDDSFDVLYHAFTQAFSDYLFPFDLTETQFRNHLVLNAVDLTSTIGCFEGEQLIGFSLNGFGEWEGKRTVYDAGTAVVPSARRQGVSRTMFEKMIPDLKHAGHEQYLLEVITTNAPALRLYQNLGFEKQRELALLQCDSFVGNDDLPNAVDIREIAEPDWEIMSAFWDGNPSWQNSIDAIGRSRSLKRILGAFIDDRCVGYAIFSSNGRIAQIAVDKLHRNRGIATALLARMRAETASEHPLQVINIDTSLTAALAFFRSRGFCERLTQYEMIKAF
jgi:ribosomal protein S18 acetylase RimI-like enzyme